MDSPSDRPARPPLTRADLTERRMVAPAERAPQPWAAAFVLSQRQADGDTPAGPWQVVDHHHTAAEGGEIRYPGLAPLDAMQASADSRQRYADRRAEQGGPVVLFVAVPVEEMVDHGVAVKAKPGTRKRAS